MKLWRVKSDNECGVARGIDLLGAACTLNFDLSTFTVVCTHRLGLTTHTGRGWTAILPCSRFPSLKAQSGRWWAERTIWQRVEGGDEAGTAGLYPGVCFRQEVDQCVPVTGWKTRYGWRHSTPFVKHDRRKSSRNS